MKFTHLASVLLTSCLMAAPLSAAVTYVDAAHWNGSSGNTYATGSSLTDTSWVNFTDSSNEDQDQWRLRPGTSRGAGDTIYQARTNGGDTMTGLTTQLTGLADGTYNIYVYFWDDDISTSNTHNIDAGLSLGSLTTYGADNPLANGVSATVAPLASSLTHDGSNPTGSTLFSSSSYNLHAALLGQATVTGGSTVNVYVDHFQPTTIAQGSTSDLTSTAQVRSFFDGIGYEAVPEPSSALLGALGTMALLGRRRR